jgi:alpha-glucosidase (family GH31 glycosyl hydrolase)
MHRRDFPTSPKATPTSIVTAPGANYRFTVLTDGLVRYEWSADGRFEDRASTFAINRDLPTPKFRVLDQGQSGLEIITARFHLTYSKKPFMASSLTAQVLGNVSDWKSRWRYGEPAENLGGTARTLDDIDGRMPLDSGILARYGYSTIDDSSSMLFDGHGWVASRMDGERIDGYLFAYGHDYRTAILDFYRVSGNAPLLPRWALGNWWSRFYAYSADQYLELMDRFKDEDVPMSVAVVDVDWHLIHDERVQATGSSGWTGYTWSDTLFPDPEGFMAEIHKRNLKITLNDHPADGVYSFEDAYEAMAKVLNHNTSDKDPIPFDITNPTFCGAFFDVLRRPIENQGNDFWWMDWQQGKYSRVPGLDPLWILNHFSFLDNAHGGKRPLHFSRFAGPGSHRYPVGFSGDSVVSWASLQFQPEFTNTASNIGYGWWSHDIGGHRDGVRDDELGTRWLQYGVFSPIMRLHSSTGLWMTKEPWSFSLEAAKVQTKFLQLRHRLLPYLYSMNYRATEGVPLCQPMYWDFPKRDEAYSVPNQYYFGSQLIVVPITSPRNLHTRQASCRGWLPPGKFVDIFSETVYDGDRFLWLHRSLDGYPVLAPQGAMIPLDGNEIPDNGCPDLTKCEILIVVGADGSFDIFEDDGAGVATMKRRRTTLSYFQTEGKVEISASDNIPCLPKFRDWTLRFLACQKPSGVECLVNNVLREVNVEVSHYGFKVNIGSVPTTSSVTVTIGKAPHLHTRDSRSQLKSTVGIAQIEFGLKNQIWEALEPGLSRAMQMAHLHALPLDKPMLDVLLEILLAEF